MSSTWWAAVLAATVSALLLVIVLVRDVGLNVVNGWTIALGFLAAGLLWSARGSAQLLAGCIALLAGMLPALIGGMGLLYVPPLVLAAVSLRHNELAEHDQPTRG